ncbi:dynamin family protein [Alicyclobacillus sp. ALC3]|uniref:dynamin family protein n=1 Tax=Alicyclobacillus sp. ALC3 TaxID=2796143 RepID=UPI0023795CB4|nr:dynamin family protein [Alicyclobacillus sp. ALC3]WDL98209.1 dynamin family protein [Alicyclobacillus sp. ALC3]
MSEHTTTTDRTCHEASLGRLVDELDAALNILDGLSEVEQWHKELDDVRRRMLDSRRLVAVFGAFSAGKSSLLNALLEDPLLAVSPNPTTAAVTRLTADEETQVVVTAKTVDELWEDVEDALNQVHRPAATMAEALDVATTLKLPQLPVPARRPAAFLQAVASGYADMRERLGTSWPVSRAQLRAYTADERIACFLKQVDVSHPSTLLQDGFDMVDTPGVDSVHRRHTDVAFRYMSRADAIMFVLYYTHAFSRADKDFLLQLAGVQDVLKTDKLFVVINAVDLAVSDEERAAVRERVESELRQAGIRRPRVFEVSSQLALAGAQLAINPDQPQFQQLASQRLGLAAGETLPEGQALLARSGVPELAESLRSVSEENRLELAQSAVGRVLGQVGRQVHARWLTVRKNRETDEAARAQRAQACSQLNTRLLTLRSQVAEGSSEIERSLAAGWDELSFHAGERIRLRLGELFREAFHPGRFRDSGRIREALMDAAAELATTLSRQVDLEARTFALRIKRQTADALSRWRDTLQVELDEVGGGAIAVAQEPERDDSAVQTEFAVVDARAFVPAFTHFKSARQFFEGEGQQTMRVDVEEIATQEIRAELGRILQHVTDAKRQHWRTGAADIIDTAMAELSLHLSTTTSELSEEGLAAWQHADEWFTQYRQA